MKSLMDILAHLEIAVSTKDYDKIGVHEITSDSRQVTPGTLFVAINGGAVDGHEFIDRAICNGCVAVVADRRWAAENRTSIEVPLIGVEDTRKALGDLAVALYGNPAQGMSLVGVTGTNGKTTTTYILENIITCAGGKPGVIGTINYRFGGNEIAATHTTPEPVNLQKTLRLMKDSGVTHVVMEVSSHALEQKRLEGLKFDAALFTNLTRDHLDYHADMESYYSAKKKLFTEYLKDGGFACLILDEDSSAATGNENWGERLAKELQCCAGANGDQPLINVQTCGKNQQADIHVELQKSSFSGLCGSIYAKTKRIDFTSQLVGDFNAKNILGAGAVAISLGFDQKAIGAGISGVTVVPGRMERVCFSPGQNNVEALTVFVDYAHTPDALENVLNAVQIIKKERIFLVFGCGGDRDQGKRFLMGEIAGRLADVVVVTTDNSRTEEADEIIREICRGVESSSKMQTHYDKNGTIKNGYIAVRDRSEAIRIAINCAGKGDVILVCGKGHENYQITKEGKVFFDDRQEVRRYLANVH
nr:UDP-N-acetylmuramoyl-L-alanyl-D-glutamate--2,6-diaminopimelate ligase [Desulfobulbaceae bacterium]